MNRPFQGCRKAAADRRSGHRPLQAWGKRKERTRKKKWPPAHIFLCPEARHQKAADCVSCPGPFLYLRPPKDPSNPEIPQKSFEWVRAETYSCSGMSADNNRRMESGKMIIRRMFKSNALEIWKIEIPDTESTNYLIISDQKRPSTLADYPWLDEADKKFFEPRENFIKVQFVSNQDLQGLNLSRHDVSGLADDLLAHVAQAHCDWNIDFLRIANPDRYVRALLNKQGIKDDDVSRFKYLSQD